MYDAILKRFETRDELREFENGRFEVVRIGSLFHIPAVPHDSWVVGHEPYVSLHFMGAEKYAAGKKWAVGTPNDGNSGFDKGAGGASRILTPLAMASALGTCSTPNLMRDG